MESLGEGRLGMGLPPAEPAHSRCGCPPTCRGSLRLGSRVVAQGFPEMDKAGGPAPRGTDCHAQRLAEEPRPCLELCPALVQGQGL